MSPEEFTELPSSEESEVYTQLLVELFYVIKTSNTSGLVPAFFNLPRAERVELLDSMRRFLGFLGVAKSLNPGDLKSLVVARDINEVLGKNSK